MTAATAPPGPSAYGLEHQARCIVPFYQASAPQGVHRFLVGTSNFSRGNKLYLIDFHEQTRIADCSAVWSHDEEIWGISASPSTSTHHTLFSTYTPAEDMCVFHRVTEEENGELRDMERLGALPVGSRQVLWDTEGLQSEIRCVGARDLTQWKLEPLLSSAGGEHNATPMLRITLPTTTTASIERAVNDPHHSSVCGIATSEGIWFADTREKRVTAASMKAPPHGPSGLRWMDYSGASMHKFLTTGTDGVVAVWDTRHLSSAVSLTASSSTTPSAAGWSEQSIRAHQHFCNGAAFHPFHDQLITSWGSDHTCKLWNTNPREKTAPASSSPSLNATARLSATGSGSPSNVMVDGAIAEKSLSEFGESVYSCVWSATSGSWVFAAVSFHGKVLVDTVPNETKLGILLVSQHSEEF